MRPVTVRAEAAEYRVAGRALVQDVSFALEPGTLTALVGPNGAGKSTMLGLLAGDLEPSGGGVLIGDRPAAQWPAKPLARLRAVMLQQHSAHFGFSVRETVAMGRLPHDVDEAADEEIVEAALTAGELGNLRDRDVTTLSGGEAARVAFARTAVQTTPVILLDEPTAALDLRHQELLLRTAQARRDLGATVVVVLHDLNLAARYADRVLMFSSSRLAADGAPADVLTADRILQVYGQQVHLLRHPGSGAPLVVPAD
ncbi:heme ABC transporter ATP-binding protein [Sediminivirga luteola]|uniref:heme ABC transporter ATP-binding protein n=1 Tax=Sediminivirga luteola TaxID=1774748 RepID=UPI001E4BA361|nr:heme ABC transporter ATP-binding protein [Sediminivirga luteola]MCI2266914.1 heme ABC transporter ATP-binding protein [Sediminivirga luteola]